MLDALHKAAVAQGLHRYYLVWVNPFRVYPHLQSVQVDRLQFFSQKTGHGHADLGCSPPKGRLSALESPRRSSSFVALVAFAALACGARQAVSAAHSPALSPSALAGAVIVADV